MKCAVCGKEYDETKAGDVVDCSELMSMFVSNLIAATVEMLEGKEIDLKKMEQLRENISLLSSLGCRLKKRD